MGGVMAAEDRMRIVRESAEDLGRAAPGFVPRALVVLGSGLSDALAALDPIAEVPFSEVRGMAPPGIEGHRGRFLFAAHEGVPLLIAEGRLHLYEGYTPDTVVLPVRAARLLGAEALVTTNAAGAVSDRVWCGEIMLVTDSINLTGSSPLVGGGLEELGPRFPRMSDAHTERLSGIARVVAAELDMRLAEGVYAGTLGPQYETDAEVRMLREIGADVVGMSTVHEVIAARHAGMDCLALSAVTNEAASDGGHEEVVAAGAGLADDLGRLLLAILSRL